MARECEAGRQKLVTGEHAARCANSVMRRQPGSHGRLVFGPTGEFVVGNGHALQFQRAGLHHQAATAPESMPPERNTPTGTSATKCRQPTPKRRLDPLRDIFHAATR